MTTIDKLDEFACAALTGILAHREHNGNGPVFLFEDAAREAYAIAEAMAEERERVIARRRATARNALATTNDKPGLVPGGSCRNFTAED